MNCWLLLGVMAAASAVAQDNSNTLPAMPAPVTAPASAPADNTAPAAEPKPKTVTHHHKKPAAEKPISEPTVALTPGPATVNSKNLNARGQAGLKGEVVAHLKEGDAVTVLEQINLDKHKAGEPAQWAKIALPVSTHVWISAQFIDPETKTVKPKKLNLRAGPGENYSVLGVLEHGATVNEITTKN
ncbi:MAG TPA: hypothetical protein VHG89_04145, partial [Verrucomicrobiae bacterium]|nr:hypothetical protein [Verrucomicrobiae bacterium]